MKPSQGLCRNVSLAHLRARSYLRTLSYLRARSFRALFPLLALLLILPASAPAQNRSAPSAPRVGSATTTSKFWVNLHSHAQLAPASGISDFAARGQYVMDELKRDARATQGPFISFLKQRNAKYQSFWITNSVLVEADDVTRSLIAHLPEVQSIEPDVPIQLPTPGAISPATTPAGGVEWNVKRTHAPDVWSQYGANGQGVVVGVIDTGVLWDHPALKDHYRGNRGAGAANHNFNWYNAVDAVCTTTPCDGNGHGTHVAGTIVGNVGTFDIGVAPGAKFIACKALSAEGMGTTASVISCYQWMMAPTNVNGGGADTALRPQIVSASIGSPGAVTAINNTQDSLRAVGVLSVAAAGNNGSCRTIGSPGGAASVLTVGALNYDSTTVASFSSGGPGAVSSVIKPDLMAGGQNVTSSWKDGRYNTISGTSMATPAVAGVAALVISAAPHWKDHPVALAQLLRDTATKLTGTARSSTCTAATSPNMIYGYGEVDALAAAKKAFTTNPNP